MDLNDYKMNRKFYIHLGKLCELEYFGMRDTNCCNWSIWVSFM